MVLAAGAVPTVAKVRVVAVLERILTHCPAPVPLRKNTYWLIHWFTAQFWVESTRVVVDPEEAEPFTITGQNRAVLTADPSVPQVVAKVATSKHFQEPDATVPAFRTKNRPELILKVLVVTWVPTA